MSDTDDYQNVSKLNDSFDNDNDYENAPTRADFERDDIPLAPPPPPTPPQSQGYQNPAFDDTVELGPEDDHDNNNEPSQSNNEGYTVPRESSGYQNVDEWGRPIDSGGPPPDSDVLDDDDQTQDYVNVHTSALAVGSTETLMPSDPPITALVEESDSTSVPVKNGNMENRDRETLFFLDSSEKRIDYVLVYTESSFADAKKRGKMQNFERNLEGLGLVLETTDKADTVDGDMYYVKIHAPWDALAKGAEILNMQKPIKMPKDINSECCHCTPPLDPSPVVVPPEEDYFTATFDRDRLDMFEIDLDKKEEFFTNAERSLIVRDVYLNRASYSEDDGDEKFGIARLLRQGAYCGSFPLHEGPYLVDENDTTPWEGFDKDRKRLYESWARWGKWYSYQPLDLIRKYYGEKVGLYFAWLGFYTQMLIPAAIFGTVVFLYGVLTLLIFGWDTSSQEICNERGHNSVGHLIMCPNCDKRCNYWQLKDSCMYAKVSYLFDNYGTVGFAVFMAVWSAFFMEFWKRKQATLQYDWDVSNFEVEENPRADYEVKAKKTKKANPVTEEFDLYVPGVKKVGRYCTSFVVIAFMICVVLAAIFGVIVYRIIIVTVFYAQDAKLIRENSKILTTVTAAVVNLIVIMILNQIYRRIAEFLTDLELPKTDTEYEDQFTVKMFFFQFVNFYGTIFYIAFFKGKFVGYPGSTEYRLFNTYRQDACDPAGCLVDLFIQLAIVMVGKQILNNAKELMLPLLLAWWKRRSSQKRETEDKPYMRWEQDQDLGQIPPLGLFEEYLEMVIQYGFVTIFVAAFPLAPLFALLNNIIEIRLDAYKFVCVWQRPAAQKAQDIGIWLDILKGITFLAIVSNAFLIAWTTEFIPKAVYQFVYSNDRSLDGFMEFSLSEYDVSHFNSSGENLGPESPAPPEIAVNGTVTKCWYRDYRRTPLDDPTDPSHTDTIYKQKLEYWHIFTARLAFIIAFEHGVFLLTYIVQILIPDVPESVKQQMVLERVLVRKKQVKYSFEDKATPADNNYSGSPGDRIDYNHKMY